MNDILYDIDTIRVRMDECGTKRMPFLFVVNFEMTEGYFVANPMQQESLFFEMNGVGNRPLNNIKHTDVYAPVPISPEEYKSKFDIVHDGLMYGNSFLTNLTVKTPLQTSMSLEDIYISARAKYKLYVPGRFVCFSPECFVRIDSGIISTYPMKGTIDASVADAERLILDDTKEAAEHNTIVDLLRNDLGMYARNIKVERFRYVDRIKAGEREILQVSSQITGELPGDYHNRLGEIVLGMLPAGSVSGAPKPATLDIIRHAESEPRGYYTGVFGYFDGERLDSGVMIRFVEEDGGQKYYRSGGGITVLSNWEKEYDEVLSKIYLPTS